MVSVTPAETEAQFRQIRELLVEHVEWDTASAAQLGLNPREVLDFYYASGEEELPGVYARPRGCLLLATCSATAAGCGAFREMSNDTCEMKRMYVRPAFRRMGIGRRLAEILIQSAQQAGYGLMRLETTTLIENAIAMYSRLGFRRCQPYYVIPERFRMMTVFMELDLRRAKSGGGSTERGLSYHENFGV